MRRLPLILFSLFVLSALVLRSNSYSAGETVSVTAARAPSVTSETAVDLDMSLGREAQIIEGIQREARTKRLVAEEAAAQHLRDIATYLTAARANAQAAAARSAAATRARVHTTTTTASTQSTSHNYSVGVEQWRDEVASVFPATAVNLMLSIMWCESKGDPNARNSSGASGLFQHLPGPPNWQDPMTNINAAFSKWSTRGTQPWDASRSCWA